MNDDFMTSPDDSYRVVSVPRRPVPPKGPCAIGRAQPVDQDFSQGAIFMNQNETGVKEYSLECFQYGEQFVFADPQAAANSAALSATKRNFAYL
jgi:hypothetical protein